MADENVNRCDCDDKTTFRIFGIVAFNFCSFIQNQSEMDFLDTPFSKLLFNGPPIVLEIREKEKNPLIRRFLFLYT